MLQISMTPNKKRFSWSDRLLQPILAFMVSQLGQGAYLNLKAQEISTKEIFYAGTELGSAWLSMAENNSAAKRNARFKLGFYAGISPIKRIRLGINLNGYLIEPYDLYAPDKGISISNNHFQLQLLPFKNWPIILNLQGGQSKYINHEPTGINRKGFSGRAGIGYTFFRNKSLQIISGINLGWGQFRNKAYPGIPAVSQRFNTIDLTVGFSYVKTRNKKNNSSQ